MGKRILIVDDDNDILTSTAQVLRKHGFEVMTAQSGRTALSVLEHTLPDLVLTDVLMPDIDGFSLFKSLKTCQRTSQIPVVIVTGRGQMRDSFAAIGACGFLAKPFTPQELISQIEETFSVRQMAQADDTDVGRQQILLVGSATARDFVSTTADFIRQAGYPIAVATSVAQAAAAAIDTPIDIVLTDVQLDKPVAELVAILRGLPSHPVTTIFGFSYYSIDELDADGQRRRVLAIESAALSFVKSGGTAYLGRWHNQLFLDLCRQNFQPNAP